MNEKMLRAIVEAGAIKQVRIIAQGARFHVEADTHTGTITAATLQGRVKTWATLDSAARWVKTLGIGNARLELARWSPTQKGMLL